MDSGSVVAALPCAAARLAGLRTAGLEVLSDLRAGMVVSCTSDVCRPNVEAHLPRRLRELHVTKSRHAAAVRCSVWFGARLTIGRCFADSNSKNRNPYAMAFTASSVVRT